MIGSPQLASIATPWLFIATSMAALAAPSTRSPPATSSGSGASTGRFTATRQAKPPVTATGAGAAPRHGLSGDRARRR